MTYEKIDALIVERVDSAAAWLQEEKRINLPRILLNSYALLVVLIAAYLGVALREFGFTAIWVFLAAIWGFSGFLHSKRVLSNLRDAETFDESPTLHALYYARAVAFRSLKSLAGFRVLSLAFTPFIFVAALYIPSPSLYAMTLVFIATALSDYLECAYPKKPKAEKREETAANLMSSVA